MILFVGPRERWQRALIEQWMDDVDETHAFADTLVPDQPDESVRVLSVFVHDGLGPDVLDRYPGVKMIAARSTGFDNIDLDACRERGIVVSNVPRYGDNTVAEHTFALILSLSRNLRRAYLKSLAGDYTTADLMGFDLKDRTLGVIGTGRIGLRVIKIAKGFSMNVLAFDVMRDDFLSDVLGFSYVTLEELLAASDIISLHAPLNDKTYHMIDSERLSQVKQGALLINTARGGLVDTNALVEALDRGQVAGAGLDVVECETFIDDQEDEVLAGACDCSHTTMIQQFNLLRRPNVVFTPHIAFNSREAIERILVTTVENIKAFLEGVPRNVVT
jgi:D-lactate dehydrogenase